MDISLQDQLYIVSISLAVVTIFFLIFCIVLSVHVSRLRADNKERKRKEREKSSGNTYAYNNPTIQPDEELYHRGYSMHRPQLVPRLKSSVNSGYSNDPKPSKPSSVYSHSSRDLVPVNDHKATKDASKDFKTTMNPTSNVLVLDDEDDYTERQPTSQKPAAGPVTHANNNGNNNGYMPPRPSQFNKNIMLGPNLGQNQNADNRQDGVTYFNNRAIDY